MGNETRGVCLDGGDEVMGGGEPGESLAWRWEGIR